MSLRRTARGVRPLPGGGAARGARQGWGSAGALTAAADPSRAPSAAPRCRSAGPAPRSRGRSIAGSSSRAPSTGAARPSAAAPQPHPSPAHTGSRPRSRQGCSPPPDAGSKPHSLQDAETLVLLRVLPNLQLRTGQLRTGPCVTLVGGCGGCGYLAQPCQPPGLVFFGGRMPSCFANIAGSPVRQGPGPIVQCVSGVPRTRRAAAPAAGVT